MRMGMGSGTEMGTGLGTVTLTGSRTKIRAAAKTETETIMGVGVAPGEEMGTRTGPGTRKKRGGGRRELGNPPHQNRSKVGDQAQSFRTRHHLCRPQDSATVRRCCCEEKTRSQGREGASGNENRDN